MCLSGPYPPKLPYIYMYAELLYTHVNANSVFLPKQLLSA